MNEDFIYSITTKVVDCFHYYAEWLNLPHYESVGILLLNVNRQTVPLAAFRK
jgi:hypothetical protein